MPPAVANWPWHVCLHHRALRPGHWALRHRQWARIPKSWPIRSQPWAQCPMPDMRSLKPSRLRASARNHSH
eukprot:8677621-Pyramimonas_sp.AAC.1